MNEQIDRKIDKYIDRWIDAQRHKNRNQLYVVRLKDTDRQKAERIINVSDFPWSSGRRS